jgi:hypothetical protein
MLETLAAPWGQGAAFFAIEVEFKKSPGNKRSGAAKPGFRNCYLVVFSFEPLWLLADMYMLLWCLVP